MVLATQTASASWVGAIKIKRFASAAAVASTHFVGVIKFQHCAPAILTAPVLGIAT